MSKGQLLRVVVALALLVSMSANFFGLHQAVSANGIPDDAIEIMSCNFVADTEGGYYYLSSDLACSQEEHGIVIDADGITIDGNGHKITGDKAAKGCESVTETDPQNGCCGILNEGYDSVTLRNIEIENFCTGVILHGRPANPVENNIIKGCTVHDNGLDSGASATHGIHMTYAENCQVINSEVYNQLGAGPGCGDGGNGIFMYAGGDNLIDNNNLHHNTKGGIFTKMKPHDVTVSNNSVTENGQGGIILRCKLSRSFNISSNTVSNNFGAGIYVGGPDNTVQDNLVTGNRAGSQYHDDVGDFPNGIRVSREADNTVLRNNTVTDNANADIYIKEDLTGCERFDNDYGVFEGLEAISGKVVQPGDSEIASSSASMSTAEIVAIVLGILAVVVLGFGFAWRRMAA